MFVLERFGSNASNIKNLFGGVREYNYYNKNNDDLTVEGYFPTNLGLKIGDRIRVTPADKTNSDDTYIVDGLEDDKIHVRRVSVQEQIFVMPEATESRVGQIVQYMGEDSEQYTHGVLYICKPVYGDYSINYSGTGSVTDVQLNLIRFMNSAEYREGQTSYIFTCVRGGLRQQWQTPSGARTNWLDDYGISYEGLARLDDTITITASIVGYAWEAYAGVSAGNDQIQITGDKIYGVNVVPQYTRNTIPDATERNAGMICQFRGSGSLLDIRQDGYFYQVTENVDRRDFSLEAEPNKYSSLYISDFFELEDFMHNELDDVTFYWSSTMSGTGWLMRDSMIDTPTADLSQYGISYTLADGQTLTNGDEITIHIMKSYYWKNIQVQPDDFIVDVLPNASEDNYGRVLFLAGSDALVPLEGYPIGKWYRCQEFYNEDLQEWYYDWVLVPNQISLPMVTEMETDANKVITGQCFAYVGDDSIEYSNDLQRIVLRKGHVYRAVVKYPDDPIFATVCYYDVYPYQFDAMPVGEEEYNAVVAQYAGTDESTYLQGHFYRCVPTGNLTPPSSMSKIGNASLQVVINANTLATQVADPTQELNFEFRSQAEGADWVLKVNDTTWTTVNIADYGITVTGDVPYGTVLDVKYVEPQPEYIWQDLNICLPDDSNLADGNYRLRLTINNGTKTLSWVAE